MSPWESLTDRALDRELLAAEARLDAVEHTLASLKRERARRDELQAIA